MRRKDVNEHRPDGAGRLPVDRSATRSSACQRRQDTARGRPVDMGISACPGTHATDGCAARRPPAGFRLAVFGEELDASQGRNHGFAIDSQQAPVWYGAILINVSVVHWLVGAIWGNK